MQFTYDVKLNFKGNTIATMEKLRVGSFKELKELIDQAFGANWAIHSVQKDLVNKRILYAKYTNEVDDTELEAFLYHNGMPVFDETQIVKTEVKE